MRECALRTTTTTPPLREGGPQKGEGRQGEGEEDRRRRTRRGSQQGFFWVLCNEVIRASEPYLILKTPSACICFEQLDPFVSCFLFFVFGSPHLLCSLRINLVAVTSVSPEAEDLAADYKGGKTMS